MHVRPLVVGLLAAGAVLGLTGASPSAASIPHSVLYTSTAPGIGNIPSVGVEAYGFNQIGDEVMLRRVAKIKSVAVASSRAGHVDRRVEHRRLPPNAGATFTTPITLNLYHRPPMRTTGETTPGALIATVTRTFTIPYRPSASPHCTGASAGEWFKNGQGCFNGLAHTIGFTLTGLKTKLPRDVVWGVSYNSDNMTWPWFWYGLGHRAEMHALAEVVHVLGARASGCRRPGG